MKNKISILYFILPIFSFLSSQDFSVESILNDYHIKESTNILYEDNWLWINKYYSSILNERYRLIWHRKENIYQKVSLILPDSITEKVFRIKKGEIVTQLCNNQILGTDTISNIEVVRYLSSSIVFYFLLKNMNSRHENWDDSFNSNNEEPYYFYVIGSRDVEPLKIIDTYQSVDDSLLDRVVNILNDEIEKNRHLWVYFKLYPNIEVLDTIKIRLKRYCNVYLSNPDFDSDSEPDTFLRFKSNNIKKSAYWDFSVILYSSTNNYALIPFSFFEFALKVDGKSFFMFRKYGPGTGIRGRTLYYYDKNEQKLKKAFGDFTWTD